MSQLGGIPILILKEGTERSQGKDAREKNIMAIQAVAESVKSTLGPRGMDKMLVDSLGDITVTNDGATILNHLELDHPGAKMAVAIAKSQDENVGDGTTSCVIIAGQLLTVANELMNQSIHPTAVARGFQLAGKKAREIVKNVAKKIDPDKEKHILKELAVTTMSSKGIQGDKDFFADLAISAFSKVKHEKDNMSAVKDVAIIKKKGKSVHESQVIEGIILEKEPVHPLMPKEISNVKIALINQAFEIKKTEFSSDLRISDPSQIQGFLDQEDSILKHYAEKMHEIGVNFVVSQKGIDDDVAHYLNKFGIVAVKSVTKTDHERLQKAVGGNIMETIESISPKDLGLAGKVEFKKIAGDDICIISGCKNPKAVSILLRSGVNQGLEEAERTLHDALCVVATTYDRAEIVGGGGAIEMEISARLLEFAKDEKGKEQVAIESFARAMEIIPITLAENAGLDPINIIADLRTKHIKPGNEFWGLEIFNGKVMNNLETGVIEPAANIDQMLKSAVELAIMILRIDDMIKGKSTSGGRGGPGGMPPGGPGGMPDMD